MPTQATKTILITSVGSMVGQNILDALEGRRERLRIVGINSQADAAGNFRCDRAYLVPPASAPEAYSEAVARVVETEAVDLVLAGRDDDVLLLARMRAERPADPAWQGRFLAGTLEAAQIMDDKVLSREFAQRAGLPFAPTVSTDAGPAEAARAAAQLLQQYGWPLIAKPRCGNGSRGIRVLTSQGHLDAALRQPGIAVQPMFDPPTAAELDPDLDSGIPFFWAVPESRLLVWQGMVGPDGALGPLLCAISTMVAGRCEYHARRTDPELLAVGRAFCSALAGIGWRGPFNLQAKRDPKHGLQVIEMNGRFSGGTSIRTLLGYDEVGLTLNQWLGGPFVPSAGPCVGNHAGVRRMLANFPTPQGGVAQLQEEGVWTRSC